MVFHAKIRDCLEYFVHGCIMLIVHFLLTQPLKVTLSFSYMNILLQNWNCFLCFWPNIWMLRCQSHTWTFYYKTKIAFYASFIVFCLFACLFVVVFLFIYFYFYILFYIHILIFWQIANYSLQIIFHKVLVL